MPSRRCNVCGNVMVSRLYEAHMQRHKNQSKTRVDASDWSSIRARVFKRDKGRCVKCGRSKKTLDSLGVQLHAHHIIEKQYGGSDDLSNLQTVCGDCHPGRGGNNVGRY